MIKQYRKSQ